MFFFIAAGLAETMATANPTDISKATSTFFDSLTSPQAVAALIGVVSALLVLLLGNLHKNKELNTNIQQKNKELFSHTVSRGRLEWVKEARELCMELCAICEAYSADKLLEKENSDKLLAFYKARSGLLLHLSPWNTYTTDNELIRLLNPLEQDREKKGEGQLNPLSGNPDRIKEDFLQVQENCPRIRAILTEIGKTEWVKVKIESGDDEEKKKKIENLQNPKTIENSDAAEDS